MRSNQFLYDKAQAATPERASALYALLATRLPELQEYCLLWSAQARLPKSEAVADLHDVIHYRPDGAAAYAAHLALARYYATIESPQTVTEYRAALKLDSSVAVGLELARYLEDQSAWSSAFAQYASMLGPSYPDAFAGMRRTGASSLTIGEELLTRRYCSDVVDTLRTVEDCEAHFLRASALTCLGREDAATAERAAYEECSNPAQPNPDSASGERGEGRPIDPVADEGTSQGIDVVDEPPSLLESDSPVDWWSATWDMEVEGNLTEALALYLRIAERDTYVADDAAYRALVLSRRLVDKESEGRALALLEGMQPNWLAWRATGTLRLEMAPPYPEEAVTRLTDGIMRKVAALESLGLDAVALRELRLAAWVSETPEVLQEMAHELLARGEVAQAYSFAAAYLAGHPYAPRAFWELSYPPAYEDQVRASMTDLNVDPELAWAIMRQESTYKPLVTSGAGARGLMQLMPGTQEEIAQKLDRRFEPGDAFRPDINVRFGGWYLDSLLDYYEGDLNSAIMAYNAGPGNVDQWREDPAIETADDLIRFAWFGETREYLERVSLDYLIYKELYGADSGAP